MNGLVPIGLPAPERVKREFRPSRGSHSPVRGAAEPEGHLGQAGRVGAGPAVVGAAAASRARYTNTRTPPTAARTP